MSRVRSTDDEMGAWVFNGKWELESSQTKVGWSAGNAQNFQRTMEILTGVEDITRRVFSRAKVDFLATTGLMRFTDAISQAVPGPDSVVIGNKRSSTDSESNTPRKRGRPSKSSGSETADISARAPDDSALPLDTEDKFDFVDPIKPDPGRAT